MTHAPHHASLGRWLRIGALLALAAAPARADTLPLPDGARMVGRPATVQTSSDDTLVDVARRHDLGFDTLAAANPRVDLWLPGAGTAVLLPTAWILPDAPREGVVINRAELRLYHFPPPAPDGAATVVTHPVSLGRAGLDTPTGRFRVTGKRPNPYWIVPPSVRAEAAAAGRTLPAVVPPGPDNPLGRFALELDLPSHLIHGTDRPYSVGMRITHGCVRLYPEDMEALFAQVPVGTPVRVVDQPYKAALHDGVLYVEAHAPGAPGGGRSLTPAVRAVSRAINPTAGGGLPGAAWERVMRVARAGAGVPVPVAAWPADASAPEAEQAWVRAGAFRRAPGARARMERLAELGLPAACACAADGFCRVAAGPYDALAAAAVAAFVGATLEAGAVVTAAPPHGAACEPPPLSARRDATW